MKLVATNIIPSNRSRLTPFKFPPSPQPLRQKSIQPHTPKIQNTCSPKYSVLCYNKNICSHQLTRNIMSRLSTLARQHPLTNRHPETHPVYLANWKNCRNCRRKKLRGGGNKRNMKKRTKKKTPTRIRTQPNPLGRSIPLEGCETAWDLENPDCYLSKLVKVTARREARTLTASPSLVRERAGKRSKETGMPC